MGPAFNEALISAEQRVHKRVKVFRICYPVGKFRTVFKTHDIVPGIVIACPQSCEKHKDKHKQKIRPVIPDGIALSGGDGGLCILFGDIRQNQSGGEERKQLKHKANSCSEK